MKEIYPDGYIPFDWPEPISRPLFSSSREIWGADENQVWVVKEIRRILWGPK